jgi:hypothetical protein
MFFWMRPKPQESDGRLKGTVIIWIFATLLFALSVPIAALMHSALLPLVVLGGAAFATTVVWMLGNRKQTATQKRVEELEERIANLEMLMCFSHRNEDDPVAFLEDDIGEGLTSAVQPTAQRVRAKINYSRQKVAH